MKLTCTFVLLQLVHGNRWLNRNRLQGRASSSKVKQLKCWTCNARNETLCDEEGDNRECNQGQVCSTEVRKRSGVTINVNMGCKQAQACETNHLMNFRDP